MKKSKNYITVIISVSVLFPVFIPPAFPLASASDSNPPILSVSKPELLSVSTTLDHIRVGDDIIVATAVRNNDEIQGRRALVIIEVRDSIDGTTVLLDWQNGTIQPDGSTQVGVSWVPQHAGEYELRTFAISGFDNPEILSSVSSSEVTIASARASYPLLVGNKTFDVQYSFSTADGIVRSMNVGEWAAVLVNVDVVNDTTLELVFPRKMLERLETESGYHYCVGNEFVPFVNGVPADFLDSSFTGSEEILTIPVKAGSTTLEIVGSDLLQSPPTCLSVGLEHYSFVKDLPGVNVDTYTDAMEIARDYLDNLAQSNGEEEGAVRGGPLGSVELVYLHVNGTAFIVNRYDGLLRRVPILRPYTKG